MWMKHLPVFILDKDQAFKGEALAAEFADSRITENGR